MPSAERPDPSDRAPSVWPDAEARFFAEGLDRSDYVQAVGGTLRAALGPAASLLDIGAGSGVLGRHLLADGGRWTALEPSRYMRARLGRIARRDGLALACLDARWEDLPTLGLAPHRLALCANVGGSTVEGDPRRLLAAARPLAGTIAWVVSAQRGPRTFCLSGFLPDDLHGLDTRPGYQLTLARLDRAEQPDCILFADWRFRAVFADRDAARAHFRHRLGPIDAGRLRRLDDHLDACLVPVADGIAAEAPKRSAILIWTITNQGDVP